MWGKSLHPYHRKRTSYIPTGYTHSYAQLYTHENTHMYTKSSKNNHKKVRNPIEKWTKDTNTQFAEKEIQMPRKYIIGCLTSFTIKEAQIKTLRKLFLTYQIGKNPKA